jgi:hypothetical protein
MEIIVDKDSAARNQVATVLGNGRRDAARADKPPDGLRFLGALVAFLVLFSFLWGAAAYIVNPYGKFPPRIFPVITLSDRNEKMNLFVAFAKGGRVDELILGSSRAMMLSPTGLAQSKDERNFNFAVTAAVPEDWLAIYRWVRGEGAHPKTVIVALDIETLDRRVPWTGDLKESPRLVRMISSGRPEGVWERWRMAVGDMKDTFRRTFAWDAARSVFFFFRPKPAAYRFHTNGVITYDTKDQERSRGMYDLDANIQTCISTYNEKLGAAAEISLERRSLLETLIQEAQRDGAQVVLWVTPFQPVAGRLLMLTHPSYLRLAHSTDSYLQELKRRFGVKLVDISSIAHAPEVSGAWYDCVHYDALMASKITDMLRSAR